MKRLSDYEPSKEEQIEFLEMQIANKEYLISISGDDFSKKQFLKDIAKLKAIKRGIK